MTGSYALRYLSGKDKIAAIKLVRELTGMGLADSKDAIETQHVIFRKVEHDRAAALAARFEAVAARVELIEEAEHLHAFDPQHPDRANQQLERLRWFGRELAWERGQLGNWQRDRSEHVASIASRDHLIETQRQQWADRGLATAARELDVVQQLSAREPSLEQQLRSGVGEVASVYADWLQQQGDPRGSLMALGLAREANPARRGQLESAFTTTLAEHRSHVFGPVGDPSPYVELEWSSGTVVGISLFRHSAEPREPWPRGDDELLAQLLALPICGCLRSLRTDSSLLRTPELWSILHACDPVQLAGLRELVLVPRYAFQSTSIDWTRFTGLERLELYVSDRPEIHAPCLRELSMRPWELATVVETLVRSSLEQLQVLTLDLDNIHFEPTNASLVMAQLLALPIVTSLRCLRLLPRARTELASWLAQALIEARGLGKLEAIEVRHSDLGPSEQRLLRAAKQRVPNLVLD
jgi:hypothetical protein